MEKQATNGLSVFTLMFIVLFILKILGTITCSWWIVTMPLWIAPAIIFAILGVCLGVAVVGGIIALVGYLIFYLYERFS